MLELTVEQVEQIRADYIRNDNESIVKNLSKSDGIMTSIFREELIGSDNGVGNSIFLNEVANSSKNVIFGLFECSYNPGLKVEYGHYKVVNPLIKVKRTFSNIRCYIGIDETSGLKDEGCVAIFPENFKGVKVTKDQPVFFFVDKFAIRHIKYTRPKILMIPNDLFDPLKQLQEKDLHQLIANWVHLHEAFHRTGSMPLPTNLFEKSGSYSAALEELRVDLETILFCFKKNKKLKNIDSTEYLTGLYVLSERLIAYPLFRTKKNFDTKSSVLFFKILKNKGIMSIKNLTFDNLISSIVSGINFISSLENECREIRSSDERKRILNLKVEEFLGSYMSEYEAYMNFWSNE
jgi:hypothetical protein